MNKIGYCRVSSEDQNLDRQITALEKAGCSHIYMEKLSGKDTNRPELRRMLKNILPGEMIVVQKLDRLGRSTIDLIKIVGELRAGDVQFMSLTESIDTTTAVGKCMFQMIAVFAEFERNLIKERVTDGMNNARAKGKVLGPKFKIAGNNEVLFKDAIEKGLGVSDISKKFKLDPVTVYRNMDRLNLRETYNSKNLNQIPK